MHKPYTDPYFSSAPTTGYPRYVKIVILNHTYFSNNKSELWKDLCFRECRLTAVGRYSIDDVPQAPDSWRSRCLVSLLKNAICTIVDITIFFKLLKVVEEKLLEEARSKLRSKLMKAVEHKKEREVKYTDRVPPPKRTRTGCTRFQLYPNSLGHSRNTYSGNTSVPAKTLFQKTRSDASKLQKNIYNARMLPPMPAAKNYGQVAPQMALEPSSSRVTVNTVIKRRPISAPLTLLRSVTSSETALSAQSASSSATSSTTPQPLKTTSPISISSSPPTTTLTASESPRIVKSSPTTNKTIKKDPMAALFVPKRKAYSQRPV